MKGVPNTLETVLARVDRTGDCWTWTGCTNSAGYGRVIFGGKSIYVHRLMYQHYIGPIPDGYQIDHLCRVRNCCRPDHLEAVTPQENSLRGMNAFELTGLCMNGIHDMTQPDAILYSSDGRRTCRACRKALMHRLYLRYRAAANH